MNVLESEDVEHNSMGVPEGIGFQDVHAPGRERPRERSEKEWTVASHHGEFPKAPAVF